MSKDGLKQKGVGGPNLIQSEKEKQCWVGFVSAGEIKDLGGVEELGVKIEDVRLVVKNAIVLRERQGRLNDLAKLSRGQVDCDGQT